MFFRFIIREETAHDRGDCADEESYRIEETHISESADKVHAVPNVGKGRKRRLQRIAERRRIQDSGDHGHELEGQKAYEKQVQYAA